MSIDVGLLVPTPTAMYKSIIDAHISFRDYLARNHIHNYSQQAQGDKTLLNASFITQNGIQKTTCSLYRPETKCGDPRIWFYNLKDYADPNNLLAVTLLDKNLYIINCSKEKILDFALSEKSPLSPIIRKDPISENPIALELLSKMKAICQKGFIKTITPGDTGIGMTLEAELGLPPNASRSPDYKGIEIKASRKKPSQPNRVNLFSKVPNWKISPIATAENLLTTRGYLDENGRKNLYHTVSAINPNSLGLQLEIDQHSGLLKQVYRNGKKTEHDASWQLASLKDSLRTKHPETFWVKAQSKIIDGAEHFHFTEVTYTRRPRVEYFEILLEAGIITMDYTMHLKESGGVRDHGYLFKINPNSLDSLFPSPVHYSLTS